MSQVWTGTIGQERPFAGFYGAEAHLNFCSASQSGWPGAQEADAYLWPSISSELEQRAGWALGAPPPPSESGGAPPGTVGSQILGPDQGAGHPA